MSLPVNTIITGDCMDVMSKMDAGSVDMILTDPPYKIIVNKRGGGTGFYKQTDHLADIHESFGSDFSPEEFVIEADRVCGGNIITWTSQSLLTTYIGLAEKLKRKWDLQFYHKSNAIPANFNHLMNDTEYIIIMLGGAFVNRLEYTKYRKYYIGQVQPNNGHPTPKPVGVLANQIEVFSDPGNLVLDCYAGSGSSLVAAKALGRRYIGIEIEPKYVEIAEQRLAQERLL